VVAIDYSRVSRRMQRSVRQASEGKDSKDFQAVQ
jgi:hypothetical protein